MKNPSPKKGIWIRVAIASFIGANTAVAMIFRVYALALSGLAIGILFLILVGRRNRILMDERAAMIQEKAARMTYAVFAPTIALGSFVMIVMGRANDSPYLESLGTVLFYLMLFLIILYGIFCRYYNRKLGGGDDEE